MRENPDKVAAEAGIRKEDLRMFKKGTRAIGNFILTNEDDKKLYYEQYSCMPPPLFMLIITAAEVTALKFNKFIMMMNLEQ